MRQSDEREGRRRCTFAGAVVWVLLAVAGGALGCEDTGGTPRAPGPASLFGRIVSSEENGLPLEGALVVLERGRIHEGTFEYGTRYSRKFQAKA